MKLSVINRICGKWAYDQNDSAPPDPYIVLSLADGSLVRGRFVLGNYDGEEGDYLEIEGAFVDPHHIVSMEIVPYDDPIYHQIGN